MKSATKKQNFLEHVYHLLPNQLVSQQPSQREYIRWDCLLTSMTIPWVWIETKAVWKPETQHKVYGGADFCFHHLSPRSQRSSERAGTFAISSSKSVCITSDSAKCSYSKISYSERNKCLSSRDCCIKCHIHHGVYYHWN